MDGVATIYNQSMRPHLAVTGNSTLSGRIKISGAKNSALVLMAASLLTKEKIKITNIPSLTDIHVMAKILAKMGVKIQKENDTLWIDSKKLNPVELPSNLVHSLRASFFCIGPLLARLGEAKVPLPGGCQIGLRPVNEHLKGLRALGAKIDFQGNIIKATIPGKVKRLKGANITFNCPSVGATETILMAATLSEGTSIINNAAQEPEIEDLANMLNSMGAKITGAGSPRIKVEGVNKLHGCIHTAIPDRIEAGTFLIAAAITRSTLLIGPVISNHLNSVLYKLRECGCTLLEEGDSIKIIPGKIKGVEITTAPFPGFPTDLQAPFMALMTTAQGLSSITENIFENRMQHVKELKRMGASIEIQSSTAFIKGVDQLNGHNLKGKDLRSTAAIILASLSANGRSFIEGLHHLDRGYENFEQKLNNVGASVVRNKNEISMNNYDNYQLATHNNPTFKQEAA
tara:strand:+ start:28330 stop:29703 length:1374 start_codon:yes stop_codon:yes gene_type:complete